MFTFAAKLSLCLILSSFLAPDGDGAPPVVTAGRTFACTPTAVWDGDGPIWCAEGPKIRIAGVAAREMDERCRAGQPCPGVSGVVARDRLASFRLGTSKSGRRP